MHTLKRPIALALLMAMTLLTVPIPSNVPPVEASCAQAYIILYENLWSGGNPKQFCYPVGAQNLGFFTHEYTGTCDPQPNNTWDNCFSSYKYREGTKNTSVCLWTGYYGAGQGNKYTFYSDGGWPWPDGFADTISSVEWGDSCHLPGFNTNG